MAVADFADAAEIRDTAVTAPKVAPTTGSATKAMTLSGPSRWKVCSNSSASRAAYCSSLSPSRWSR